MANFRMHIGTAAVSGAALSGYGAGQDWWPVGQVPILIGLCIFGGIMPDIDADKSRSARLIFTVLALIAALGTLGWLSMHAWPDGALLVNLGLVLGVYVLIRDVAGPVCRWLTRHRANWHSLLAIALVSSHTILASLHAFGQPPDRAWLHGLAMGTGMLVHLCLDECYSIDLSGGRIKRSFGTACKLFDRHRPVAALMMLATTLPALIWLPAWPF